MIPMSGQRLQPFPAPTRWITDALQFLVGGIMAFKTISAMTRFLENIERIPFSGCWIWMASCTHWGYGEFYIGKRISAHRASWKLFRGEIPKGLWVLHRCDVRCCANPEHLFLGNNSDNQKDSWKKGRHGKIKNSGFKSGEGNFSTTLSKEQVIEIREKTDINTPNMARIMGVCKTTISNIRRRKTWKYT